MENVNLALQATCNNLKKVELLRISCHVVKKTANKITDLLTKKQQKKKKQKTNCIYINQNK